MSALHPRLRRTAQQAIFLILVLCGIWEVGGGETLVSILESAWMVFAFCLLLDMCAL